ncbi:MAG: hypothetical protein HUJ22_13205 [Gracilimonas sp.]|uniref:hypothetical protein n=1 Tax=Gracilimonas sp. TaxID=1974203 RepID=UPI0019947631|nr:hypothetical protein [Gracilimonas sp.]MBD3617518.1 hypothetical protein [Gracilimonas sp.]
MRISRLFLFTIAALITSCGVFNSEKGCIDTPENRLPSEGTPTQFCIEEKPEIQFVYNPDSPYIVVNEPALELQVVARDSTPHLNWLPTTLLVETDQGFSKEITLVPFACIVPIENSPEEFPFNVEWWSCNTININNGKVLTEEQIHKIETVTNAQLSVKYIFKSIEGGQYMFDLYEIGRPAIQQAIQNINQLPFITPIEDEKEEWGETVGHANQFPRCWLSDIIPPPPCPPWSFFKRIRISLEGEKENHIPVQEGGWVKATYTLPDGTVKSTIFTIPEIEQE